LEVGVGSDWLMFPNDNQVLIFGRLDKVCRGSIALARFPLDSFFFLSLLSPVAIIKQPLPAIAHPNSKNYWNC